MHHVFAPSYRAAACSLALAGSLLAGCASGQMPPAMAMDGVLAGPNHMTLYTFDKDAAGAGKSVCNGPCANNWPPFLASDSDKPSGDYTIITRDDGKRQWALKGKPLYYWSKDSKPGDTTGDGFNHVWQLAHP